MNPLIRRLVGEADSIPPLGMPSPILMNRRRRRLNRQTPLGKLVGEELIPSYAKKLGVDDEDRLEGQDGDNRGQGQEVDLGHEPLIRPELALVAPDVTPNSTEELDPSLVPGRDVALQTILGNPPKKAVVVNKPDGEEDISTKPTDRVPSVTSTSTVNSLVPNESLGLPGGDMPLPPGKFLKSLNEMSRGITEDKVDAPKVELVVGSSNSIVATGESLGASSMPRPVDADVSRTMDVYRRFAPRKQ